jgi:heterodisulfide reductase subunit D
MESVYIEKLRDDIYTCNRSRCGMCREECPVYDLLRFEEYSSRGRSQIAKGLLEGTIKPSKELLESLSLCATCGYCRFRCALPTVDLVERLRADLVKLGYELPNYQRVKERILKDKNPYGKALVEKEVWAEGLQFNESSPHLFFAGCLYSLLAPALLKKMVRILQKAGLDLNHLGEEDCCGAVLHTTGYWDEFQQSSSAFLSLITQKGIEEVITPCPSCYKTFKQTFREFFPEYNLKIRHIVEVIWELIEKRKLKFTKKVEKRVTWHDPCHLGRIMGLFEEPRKIIKSIPGIELVEMEHNRYEAKCCGGGGGLLVEFADIALDIASNRVNEAEQTKAEYVVTMCPTCRDVLSRATRYNDSQIKVIDLIELIEMAL